MTLPGSTSLLPGAPGPSESCGPAPAVTMQLENEGIDKFVKPFEKLMQALERKKNTDRQEPGGG